MRLTFIELGARSDAMICPYCLHDNPRGSRACSQCNASFPPLYVQLQIERGVRPLRLSMVGFSGHGKTVYLAALFHCLERELTRVWPRFYLQGLDVESMQRVHDALGLLDKGLLPEATRRNFPRPSIHLLANLPMFGDRLLVAYDAPGEAFEASMAMQRYAYFVKDAEIVTFLVSLRDLSEPIDGKMQRLLSTYTQGLDRMGGDTRKQHLVVVYTKADMLISTLHRYPDVVSYLQEESWDTLHNIRKYLALMPGFRTLTTE
jgi:hypothetical protein